VNRLSVRLLAVILLVAVVSLSVVPVAQTIAARVTFAELPDAVRERVLERTTPRPWYLPPRPRPVSPAPEGAVSDDPPMEDVRVLDVFGDFRAAQQRAVWFGVGAAMATWIALAWWLARSIARPIEAVSEAAEKVASGGLATRVRLRSARLQATEIRTLARAFDDMAASLERLEGERKAMIADIAHELRTPVASMSLRLEALEDGLVAFGPGEIALLRGHTDLLTRLIDDLRLLSRADAGRLELDLHELDLSAWLPEASAAFGSAGRGDGPRIVIHPAPGPLRVRADPQRLRQVLYNLLDNAVKASPPNGTIELRTGRADDHGVLAVRDHGPGIPEADLDVIFERFVQGRTRDTEGPAGTGLGLAIVRTLATLHGGEVRARDTGDGAEFEVRLPLLDSEHTERT
jgi:two-component system sensor histidine kinase BaeS